MNLVVTLLHVVALLSLGGSIRGDDVTSTGCTVTPGEDDSMHVKLEEMAIRCLEMDRVTIDHINEIDTLEGHKTFFKLVCDKKPEIRECLAGVTRSSEVCDTEMGHKFFLIFRDLLGTIVDSGCVQDGEILAKTFMNYNISKTPFFKRDHFHDCISTAIVKIIPLMRKNVELHSRPFLIYREVVNCKECFGEIKQGDVTLMKTIESILGDVVDKMKCMHPQDETAVLCKAIDVNLPDVARICPMKTLDEEKHPLNEILLDRMVECVSLILFYEESADMIVPFELIMMGIALNCEKKEEIGKCLSEVTTLSSVCLNEGQHNVMKLADDGLKHGLDSLCLDDGIPAADLLYKTLHIKTDATLEKNDVTDCMTLAHPQQAESKWHIDAADFVRYHQELKVFKGCLINKMRGDNSAVFGIHLILSSLQNNMQCLDPEHGTMVPCKSIETTPSTEVEVCPFVGEAENESPTYETFINLVTDCIKIGRKQHTNMTTLEYYQALFKSLCHSRADIQHCIVDINSISEKCLTHDDHQLMTIVTDISGNTLESGCENDGEIFATIVYGSMYDSEHGIARDKWTACGDTTRNEVKNYVRKSVAKTSAFQYQLLVNLRQCMLDGVSEAGTFKTVFANFTEGIRKNIKCVRPDDGTIGICESIVN